MTRLIRMPNGNAVRADLILYVRATEDAVHVQTPDGNWCFDMDGDDELAIRHRDRIIAEVNAACGGAAESVVVTAAAKEKPQAWLPEPSESGIFCYADGSGFAFDSRLGKWRGWWAPKGGHGSVALRGYDESDPSHETTSYFLTAEEVAQAIADGGDGPAVCAYDPLTHWLVAPAS